MTTHDRTGEESLRQALRRLKPVAPPPPQGLPGDLYDRLEMAILTCGPSDYAPLFVDERIAPWAELFPHHHCSADTVNALIATLFPRFSTAGDNALVLFLHVLSERANPADACHRRLYLLATDLTRPLKQREPRRK